jgi:hypothetical protein
MGVEWIGRLIGFFKTVKKRKKTVILCGFAEQQNCNAKGDVSSVGRAADF